MIFTLLCILHSYLLFTTFDLLFVRLVCRETCNPATKLLAAMVTAAGAQPRIAPPNNDKFSTSRVRKYRRPDIMLTIIFLFSTQPPANTDPVHAATIAAIAPAAAHIPSPAFSVEINVDATIATSSVINIPATHPKMSPPGTDIFRFLFFCIFPLPFCSFLRRRI